MATVTASQVANVRSMTGLGMMDCKKALLEADGDVQKALEILRIKSGSKASKLANRTATEGIVFITLNGNKGNILEVNCETDFVAKDDNFKKFVKEVGESINLSAPKSLEELHGLKLRQFKSVEEYRNEIIAKLGENILIRRFKHFDSSSRLESYLHNSKIGVVVQYKGDMKVAKDVCMHIVACRPSYMSSDDVPSNIIEQERCICTERAKAQEREKEERDICYKPKSIEIIKKIVKGQVEKFVSEMSLLQQKFVKNPDIKIDDFLKQNKTQILSFVIYEVGEGIEKKSIDYVAEVAAVANKAV